MVKLIVFKGTDQASEHPRRTCTMLIIVVGINLPRSSCLVVIGVQNFRVSIFYFSYREFHKFRTKTINDNDIFAIDEKTHFK